MYVQSSTGVTLVRCTLSAVDNLGRNKCYITHRLIKKSHHSSSYHPLRIRNIFPLKNQEKVPRASRSLASLFSLPRSWSQSLLRLTLPIHWSESRTLDQGYVLAWVDNKRVTSRNTIGHCGTRKTEMRTSPFVLYLVPGMYDLVSRRQCTHTAVHHGSSLSNLLSVFTMYYLSRGVAAEQCTMALHCLIYPLHWRCIISVS